MLVAVVAGHRLQSLVDESVFLGLGSAVAGRGYLGRAARGELTATLVRYAETARRLGFGEPKAFAVPQNTLVVADTVGFHERGLSARPSVRLEIWAYGRRNPFLPWLGFDPAAMPLVKGRAVPLYWSAMDLAERLHLNSNPWQSAGTASPIEYPPFTTGDAGAYPELVANARP